MNNIVKRPYRRLVDFMRGYQFMIDNYSIDWKNGAEWKYGIYDFSNASLNYQLPEGFSFEEPRKFDMKKMIEASWKCFDHNTEPEGEWNEDII